jgi:hypothetical protein
MKLTIVSLIAAIMAATLSAKPLQQPVPIQLGAKAFRDGDVIRIDEVLSTSPRLEQGDTITIKGYFRLESRTEASLQLLLTQTEGDGVEETDATQGISTTKGTGQFEVTITVKHKGYLHLTFYDTDTGKPFGGTYFGTTDQMSQAPNLCVDHYTR